MTPEEYREAIDTIGWTSEEVARRLGIHAKRAQRWRSGKYACPPAVGAWLRKLAAAVARLPPPERPSDD